MELHNERESKQITNIIGVIDGHEEPGKKDVWAENKYVLSGIWVLLRNLHVKGDVKLHGIVSQLLIGWEWSD